MFANNAHTHHIRPGQQDHRSRPDERTDADPGGKFTLLAKHVELEHQTQVPRRRLSALDHQHATYDGVNV